MPWWVSLLGFVACVAAMLMIDAGATFVALFVAALVYHAVQRRKLNARWGDVRYGVLVLIARTALLSLARRRPDTRAWNPNVLVLAGTPSSRWHLVVIARALAGDSGLLTVATVLPESARADEARMTATRVAIERYLESEQMGALVKVETDESIADGLIALVKSYGFGPLVPNTIVLGKATAPEEPLKHAELLSIIQQRRRNLIVLHEGEELPDLPEARRVDIYWRGQRGNLGLMLALAFLLKQQRVWADAEVAVWRIVETEPEVAPAAAQLETLVAATRFAARVQVIADTGNPFDVIRRHSRQANLIFLGLRARDEDESFADYAAYYANLARHTEGFPPTALVVAGDEVDLDRLFAGV